MFDSTNPYSVAAAPEDARAEFVRRTYLHVAGAIGVFTLLIYTFFQIPAMYALAGMMSQSWLLVLGAFMAVSWIAEKFANSATSIGKQYFGLGLFVVAEAIIFLPILLIANAYSPGAITKAAAATGALFFGLTFVAFTTKKDFSFLGGMLKIGGFIALGMIAISLLPIPGLGGFNLGTWFSIAMVIFAAGSILYNTSNPPS